MTDRILRPVAAIALSATAVLTLGAGLGAPALAGRLGWIAMLVYLLANLPRSSRLLRLFGVLAIAAGVTDAALAAQWPVHIEKALGLAAYVAALFAVLGLLREAANRSPLVTRAGVFLTRQRPGRRYLACAFGGHLLGLILNIGALTLMASMVVRGGGGADPAVEAIRRRRMLMAVLQGFQMIMAWSPLTFSVTVILGSMPEVSWPQIVPWALGISGSFIAVGWLLDRIFRPRLAHPPPSVEPSSDWASLPPVFALVGIIFLMGILIQAIFGTRLGVAILAGIPVIAFAWLAFQYRARPRHAPRLAARRLGRHAARIYPDYREEIGLLCCAAFIGSVLGALIPPEVVAETLTALDLPPWALLIVIVWVVVALGQAGVNPILSLTMLIAGLPIAQLGVPAPLAAVVLTSTWALTSGSSTVASLTLLTGRFAGVTATTVGRIWNGPYTVVNALILSVFVAFFGTS